MNLRRAFQTLENRDIDRVEIDGPFRCNRSDAWLGSGYYFWDTLIDVAHWWGVEIAGYDKNGYIICEAFFNLDEARCFNLVDNKEHLKLLNSTKELMIDEGLYEKDKTTVARIISFIKDQVKAFKYEAIRVYGVNSIGYKSKYGNRTKFVYKESGYSTQYLDSAPAIQICFFNKDSLDLKNFKIVYPAELSDGYVV